MGVVRMKEVVWDSGEVGVVVMIDEAMMDLGVMEGGTMVKGVLGVWWWW